MFSLEDAVEEKFDSFDETLAFVSEEKRRIVRLPISGLWKNGARFHDDGSSCLYAQCITCQAARSKLRVVWSLLTFPMMSW